MNNISNRESLLLASYRLREIAIGIECRREALDETDREDEVAEIFGDFVAKAWESERTIKALCDNIEIVAENLRQDDRPSLIVELVAGAIALTLALLMTVAIIHLLSGTLTRPLRTVWSQCHHPRAGERCKVV